MIFLSEFYFIGEILKYFITKWISYKKRLKKKYDVKKLPCFIQKFYTKNRTLYIRSNISNFCETADLSLLRARKFVPHSYARPDLTKRTAFFFFLLILAKLVAWPRIMFEILSRVRQSEGESLAALLFAQTYIACRVQ